MQLHVHTAPAGIGAPHGRWYVSPPISSSTPSVPGPTSPGSGFWVGAGEGVALGEGEGEGVALGEGEGEGVAVRLGVADPAGDAFGPSLSNPHDAIASPAQLTAASLRMSRREKRRFPRSMLTA